MKKSKNNSARKKLPRNFAMIPRSVPRSPNQMEYRRVSYTTTIASGTSVTGNIISVGSNGVTACTEWPALSTLYSEFRVNVVELTFIPRFPQSPVYTASSPATDSPSGTLMLADDRAGGTTNPTNLTGLWAWSNARVYNWSQNVHYKYIANDFEDSVWIQMVAAAAPQDWRIVFGVSNPGYPLITNQVIFDVYVEFGVQFQGDV
jgi:hypothetical protein